MSQQSNLSTIPPSFIPDGWHVARLVRWVELGHVFIPSNAFGNGGKVQHQAALSWEFPFQQRAFRKDSSELSPKMLSRHMAVSLYGRSHLLKFISEWIGDDEASDLVLSKTGISPHRIVGLPCEVYVEVARNFNNNEWYEKIKDLRYLNPTNCPDQYYPSLILEFDKFDPKVYQGLHQSLKNIIKGSDEYPTLLSKYPEIGMDVAHRAFS